ncbi:MAG: P-II family nitrogen regulator [Deltaproteobacteria bacterium]|nr:P-II family nitrogen regulator [Deltaproteobacteria bacterium]
MLMAVVDESDKGLPLKAVMEAARTGEKGAFGYGKIFVLPIDDAARVRTSETGAKAIDEMTGR